MGVGRGTEKVRVEGRRLHLHPALHHPPALRDRRDPAHRDEQPDRQGDGLRLVRSGGKRPWIRSRESTDAVTLRGSAPMQDEIGRSRTTNYRGWQSDVIVDLIKRYGFPHITLNPGASFRGLHDSLVNYGGNEPPMMLCQHEEIAVQIAHGYAKATGKPVAGILHDLVGLLHACMAIYYAYIDRVPIFIIGATGPMDEGKRRPHIDWTHSALVQGNAVRDYVKRDYQPSSIEGVPESFARAYSIITTEPQGPVYMCYDAALQEAPLSAKVPLPPAGAAATPAPMAPDPKAIEAIAEKLLAAEHPMLFAEYAGRRAGGFENIVELAETAGAAVWDVNNALNFPNKHPLCLSMDQASLRHTDLVVGLDVKDWE